MDFELKEEQKIAKKNLGDFLDKEIAPMVDEQERRGPFTREELTRLTKKLMPFGLYTGTLPEKYGGMNVDQMMMGILTEELSRVWCGLQAAVGNASVVIQILPEISDSIRQRWLPRVLQGDLIGCMALTEPNAGSNSAAIETIAVLDGDEWVINGTKTWISNGSIADVVMVVCVTDKSKGPLGISRIIVEREASPFEARAL